MVSNCIRALIDTPRELLWKPAFSLRFRIEPIQMFALMARGRFLSAGAVAVIVCLGLWLRVSWMNQSALWCDEAESSIHALSIIGTGVPGWKYVDLPIFENTLTNPWDDSEEYEFRDSTYSDPGVVVYHG